MNSAVLCQFLRPETLSNALLLLDTSGVRVLIFRLPFTAFDIRKGILFISSAFWCHFRLTDSLGLDLMLVSRLVSVLDFMGRSVVTLPPLNRKNLVTTNQNCGLSHHTTLEGSIVWRTSLRRTKITFRKIYRTRCTIHDYSNAMFIGYYMVISSFYSRMYVWFFEKMENCTFCECWMCLKFLTPPHRNFSITSVNSVEFQMENWTICRRDFRSQITQILVISRCCFFKRRAKKCTDI